MRFLPANLDALLVELDDLPQTVALAESLRTQPVEGVDEFVPGARTVLLRFRPHATTSERIAGEIARRRLVAGSAASGTRIEIAVDYQGEDLDDVARLLGMRREEVIAAHTGHDYTVAFVGFAPGFAYLTGGDPRLDVPRRPTPRTRVPAGAVALAGTFSAVYPQASPGGWQILGTTTERMWDLQRATPALLQPGFRVRFVDGRGQAGPQAEPAVARPDLPSAPAPAPAPVDGHALEVRHPGAQALLQDAGRHGHASQGVSSAGALDRAALRAANRLAGNPASTAVLEIAGGGFEATSHGDLVVAVTGADGPLAVITAGGEHLSPPRWQALALADGDRLRIGPPEAGLRSYLAVAGGFDVQPVLGSCSTDTLAAIGPAALRAGDRLAVRARARGVTGAPETASRALPRPGDTVTLDLVPGPRTDWFTDEAIAHLASQAWTVTPRSNRVGLRLNGDAPLARSRREELPSEGTVAGAVQVPADGQPVLFLADHPLTGGYPVIGAVAPYHLDLAGQIPVGCRIRFHPIRPFAALAP